MEYEIPGYHFKLYYYLYFINYIYINNAQACSQRRRERKRHGHVFGQLGRDAPSVELDPKKARKCGTQTDTLAEEIGSLGYRPLSLKYLGLPEHFVCFSVVVCCTYWVYSLRCVIQK